MFSLFFLCSPSYSAETLADWARSINRPETQRKIFDKIFPDQIGSVSTAVADKQNGTYFFTYNTKWVRLGRAMIWGSTESAKAPYLIVTCMLYHTIDEEPLTATSYLFRDTVEYPTVLTGGYSTHERLHLVKLPKLGKSFLVVEDSTANPQGEKRQWSIFLLEMDPAGISDRPATVWSSPPTFRTFQVGFTLLQANAESLVVRTVPPVQEKASGIDYTSMSVSKPTTQYAAYRWTGSRFEIDNSVFTSRLQELPDSVWQYGTGR